MGSTCSTAGLLSVFHSNRSAKMHRAWDRQTDRQTDRGITASLNAQFTPPTRQDKTSCLAWRCELAFTGGRTRHAVCKRNAADAVQRSVARVCLQGQTARTMPSQLATSRRGAVMPSSSHCCATVSVCLEASTQTRRRSVKVRVKVTRRERGP